MICISRRSAVGLRLVVSGCLGALLVFGSSGSPGDMWTASAQGGAQQDAVVSTQVVGFNRFPTIATDPTTGNHFVAWARLGET